MKLSDHKRVETLIKRLEMCSADLSRLEDISRLEEQQHDPVNVAWIQFYKPAPDLNEDPIDRQFFASNEAQWPRRWFDQSDHEEFSRKVRALMAEFLRREISTGRVLLQDLGVDPKR